MIAEVYKDNLKTPSFNVSNKIRDSIILSFIQTTSKFINHIKSSKFSKKLNEEELTQEFIALLRREVNLLKYSFCIGQEYKDIYKSGKGRTDFYFYPLEEGTSTQSIFSGEAKRLPSPLPISRKKEYVIGDNQNGGIERFKIEKHGKGLEKSCIIAFVEKEDFKYWIIQINKWIKSQAKVSSDWQNSECLNKLIDNIQYFICNSSALRKSDSIYLDHFWINTI
jgi:hypothetical protein